MNAVLVRHDVANIPIVAAEPAAISDYIIKHASERLGLHVHLVNAFSVVLANEAGDYRDALLDANAVNIADGKPVAALCNVLHGKPRVMQLRGNDLLHAVLEKSASTPLRHFFMGSTSDVLEKLVAEIQLRYDGGIDVIGADSPPFAPLTTAEFRRRDSLMQRLDPDIVWLGLGTPKQELEAIRLARRHGTTVIAIGAAFEFTAGTVAEAPRWVRRLGLEWAHRLLSEPRRLAKRYAVGNSRFIWMALKELKRRDVLS